MFSIFAVPWDRLELAEVQAFLADAGDEGVTWEAKGTERPRPETLRKAVSGFANARGGYLIIGADRGENGWQASGVDFRGVEPPVWLDQTIRDGLRPVPRFNARAWAVDGRHVAVVRVEPVAVPPCMTTSGEVFERVSGRTVKVEEPRTLAQLYQRGETAELGAEKGALQATQDIFVGEPQEESFLSFALGLASTGTAEDIAGRLFAPSFRDALTDAVEGLPMAPLYPYPAGDAYIETQMQQDALWAWTPFNNRHVWRVRAVWNGSVAVHLMLTVNEQDAPGRLTPGALFEDAVTPAAQAASALSSALGGFGRTHTVLRVKVRRFDLRHGAADRHIPGPTDLGPIQRWVGDPEDVTDAQLEGMKRELLRACGFLEFEPEPEA